VTSSPNPSTLGQLVTFFASVTGSLKGLPTPTGFVTFKEGTHKLAGLRLAQGKVRFSTSGLPSGKHTITVIYSGDDNFAPNTAPPITQVVKRP
jgi:hypothetical protein